MTPHNGMLVCMLMSLLFASTWWATSVLSARYPKTYFRNPHLHPASPQFASLDNCKIFVLDTMRFPHPVNRTPCVKDQHYHEVLTRVLEEEGIRNGPDSALTLSIQQHGWTRLLSHVILTSTAAAVNIEEADVVLVDMSCYADEDTLYWNGDPRYKGLSDASDVISQLKRTPAWKTKEGAGFVFMGPHPYSFRKYGKNGPCGLHNSYFLAPQPSQMCTIDQARANLTIVPYNAVAHAPTLKQTMRSERIHLVWFRGDCHGPDSGKLLRSFFTNAIEQSEYASDPRVIVTCKGQNHTQTTREMLASNFCLSISGDETSTRRISETIVSGCIPVFVGPPWHTRPLPVHIPWDEIALFFELRNSSRWSSGGDASSDRLIRLDALQALPENAIKYLVDEPRDVVKILETYSSGTIARFRSRVVAYRSNIMYGGHEPGQASFGPLAIMDSMCAYGKKLHMRDAWQDEKKRLSGRYLLTPSTR